MSIGDVDMSRSKWSLPRLATRIVSSLAHPGGSAYLSIIGIVLEPDGKVATISQSGHSSTWNAPHSIHYCLSKTKVSVTGLPSALVPLEVCVSVLPSLETTFLPVIWYFPPVFLVSKLVVFASIRLTETKSYGPPVTGFSLPSYLKVVL